MIHSIFSASIKYHFTSYLPSIHPFQPTIMNSLPIQIHSKIPFTDILSFFLAHTPILKIFNIHLTIIYSIFYASSIYHPSIPTHYNKFTTNPNPFNSTHSHIIYSGIHFHTKFSSHTKLQKAFPTHHNSIKVQSLAVNSTRVHRPTAHPSLNRQFRH